MGCCRQTRFFYPSPGNGRYYQGDEELREPWKLSDEIPPTFPSRRTQPCALVLAQTIPNTTGLTGIPSLQESTKVQVGDDCGDCKVFLLPPLESHVEISEQEITDICQ